MENIEFWDTLSDRGLVENCIEYKTATHNLNTNYSKFSRMSEPNMNMQYPLGMRVYRACENEIFNIINSKEDSIKKLELLEDAQYQLLTNKSLYNFNFAFLDYYHFRRFRKESRGLLNKIVGYTQFFVPSENLRKFLSYWIFKLEKEVSFSENKSEQSYTNPLLLILLYELGIYDTIKNRLESSSEDSDRTLSKLLSIILNKKEGSIRKYLPNLGSMKYHEFNPANKNSIPQLDQILHEFGLKRKNIKLPKR